MNNLLAAATALATLAGAAHAETRDVSGFTNVRAEGHFRVDVAVGPAFQVTAEGSDAGRIRTRVEGYTLRIEPINRPWFGNPHYAVSFHVTAPRLEGVAGARGATLHAVAGGECDEFSAAAAMGSNVDVSALQCASIDASAAMGADLRLAGSCGHLDVSAAMGADVRARALRCETVSASAAMGADIDAYASQTYDASASMGADISVSGAPKPGSRTAAMGGSVHDH
jgi:Putative auto-transporter adhesin, head GIN domain